MNAKNKALENKKVSMYKVVKNNPQFFGRYSKKAKISEYKNFPTGPRGDYKGQHASLNKKTGVHNRPWGQTGPNKLYGDKPKSFSTDYYIDKKTNKIRADKYMNHGGGNKRTLHLNPLLKGKALKNSYKGIWTNI